VVYLGFEQEGLPVSTKIQNAYYIAAGIDNNLIIPFRQHDLLYHCRNFMFLPGKTGFSDQFLAYLDQFRPFLVIRIYFRSPPEENTGLDKDREK